MLAKDRVHGVAEELKIEVTRHGTAAWKGQEFEGVQFQHPFLDMRVPGVLADYVTLDQGSGIVHTAPGHGADDFRTGQRYGSKLTRRRTTKAASSKACRNTKARPYSKRIR